MASIPKGAFHDRITIAKLYDRTTVIFTGGT